MYGAGEHSGVCAKRNSADFASIRERAGAASGGRGGKLLTIYYNSLVHCLGKRLMAVCALETLPCSVH